jgi:hypothetical protein
MKRLDKNDSFTSNEHIRKVSPFATPEFTEGMIGDDERFKDYSESNISWVLKNPLRGDGVQRIRTTITPLYDETTPNRVIGFQAKAQHSDRNGNVVLETTHEPSEGYFAPEMGEIDGLENVVHAEMHSRMLMSHLLRHNSEAFDQGAEHVERPTPTDKQLEMESMPWSPSSGRTWKTKRKCESCGKLADSRDELDNNNSCRDKKGCDIRQNEKKQQKLKLYDTAEWKDYVRRLGPEKHTLFFKNEGNGEYEPLDNQPRRDFDKSEYDIDYVENQLNPMFDPEKKSRGKKDLSREEKYDLYIRSRKPCSHCGCRNKTTFAEKSDKPNASRKRLCRECLDDHKNYFVEFLPLAKRIGPSVRNIMSILFKEENDNLQ